MALPQPGAASTTTSPLDAESGFWVRAALDADDARRVLLDQQIKRSTSQKLRKALNEAHIALHGAVTEYFKHARAEGKLLLCWHGTKSVEVRA